MSKNNGKPQKITVVKNVVATMSYHGHTTMPYLGWQRRQGYWEAKVGTTYLRTTDPQLVETDRQTCLDGIPLYVLSFKTRCPHGDLSVGGTNAFIHLRMVQAGDPEVTEQIQLFDCADAVVGDAAFWEELFYPSIDDD